MSYPGMEQDYSRPLLGGRARDSYGVRIMLSILDSCFWNYYEAKEKRREQGL